MGRCNRVATDAKQRQLLEETMQYANERRQALAQAQAQAAQPAS